MNFTFASAFFFPAAGAPVPILLKAAFAGGRGSGNAGAQSQCYGGCGYNWYSEDLVCSGNCKVRLDWVSCVRFVDPPQTSVKIEKDRCVNRVTHVPCNLYKWTDIETSCPGLIAACPPMDCGGGFAQSPETCECEPASPIIIDVAGNGFDLTDTAGGVTFDVNGLDMLEAVSWTAANSDDAWLALDRNNNGVIDSGQELFGNFIPQSTSGERNGFLALAAFDRADAGGDGNGKIDNRDSVFSRLRLWQDANHNGVSEPRELHTLPELVVARLHLDYKESRRVDDHGNRFKYRAKVDDAKGGEAGRWAWDVFLVGQ